MKEYEIEFNADVYNDGEKKYVKIIYNGEVVFHWNEEDNLVEDLTFSRDLLYIFEAGIDLGKTITLNKFNTALDK